MPEAALAAPSAADAVSDAAAMGGRGSSSPYGTGKNLEGAFGNLDKMATEPTSEPGKIPPHPAQKKTEIPAKSTDQPAKGVDQPAKGEKEVAKSEEQPAKEEIEAVKPTVDPAKPKKPADFLREKLQKTEQERDTFKAELEKVKTAQPTEHPEIKTLTEQVEALRKEKTRLEDEFRYVNYEKSPEYADKYQKPFTEAWERGRNMIKRLNYVGEDGNPTPATAAQFDALMVEYIQNPEKAAQKLDEMFGNRASLITPHMLEVEKAKMAGDHAIEEFKKSGADREKQWHETSSKVAKEINDHWTNATKPESVPDQWKPYVLPKGADKDGNPIDKEGDEMLTKAMAQFDRAATENARDPSLTKEQREAVLGRAAAIRNKAAAFPRLVRDLKASQTRIAELEKQLAGFQKSEPGGGETAVTDGKKSVIPADTMEGAVSALDRLAKPKFY